MKNINWNLKELVKDTKVKFVYYKERNLYYEVVGKKFMFPVPIEDTGDASFLNEDKGMFFMRYIKKYLKEIENKENNLIAKDSRNK